MSVQLSQVLQSTRTYLNDDNATLWTDPVLIPKIQEAHRELQSHLWVIGSPTIRGLSDIIPIPINTAPSAANGLTGYPTDILNPTAVWETAASPATWTPLTEQFYLDPNFVPGVHIGVYLWQEENLILAPCTTIRAIQIWYRRSIPIPQVQTDLIGILFGESYLAPRAAAICAGAVGNKPIYDAMTQLAQQNFERLLSTNRGAQNPPNTQMSTQFQQGGRG